MALPKTFIVRKDPFVEHRTVVIVFGAVVFAAALMALSGVERLPEWTIRPLLVVLVAFGTYGAYDWYFIAKRRLEVAGGRVTVWRTDVFEEEFLAADVTSVEIRVWTTARSLGRKIEDWPLALHVRRRLGGGRHPHRITLSRKDGSWATYRIRGASAASLRDALVEAGFQEPRADLR